MYVYANVLFFYENNRTCTINVNYNALTIVFMESVNYKSKDITNLDLIFLRQLQGQIDDHLSH